MAFLGARVRPGVDVVAEALGLLARAGARPISSITGEGRLDARSLRGKVPGGCPRGSVASCSVPVAIVCGEPRRACRSRA